MTTEGSNGTAAQLRDRNRRRVELEPGVEVVIRKVSVTALMARNVMPPVSSLEGASYNRMGPEFGRLVQTVLELGMAEPAIWTGKGECPPECITVEDLAPHEFKVFAAVMELSGYSATEVAAASFRGEAADGVGDPAPLADDRPLAA